MGHLLPPLTVSVGESRWAHAIGGDDVIAGADCPNCRKPLLLHLSLDLSDPRFAPLAHLPSPLRLLYCMRCALSWEPFRYRCKSPNRVEIIDVHQGAVDDEEWQTEVGDHFARQPMVLTPLPPEVQEMMDRLNRGEDLSDEESDFYLKAVGSRSRSRIIDAITQVGGRSFLPQGQPDPTCATCGGAQSFLASVYNNHPTGMLWMPKGLAAQITFSVCAECGEICVEQRL